MRFEVQKCPPLPTDSGARELMGPRDVVGPRVEDNNAEGHHAPAASSGHGAEQSNDLGAEHCTRDNRQCSILEEGEQFDLEMRLGEEGLVETPVPDEEIFLLNDRKSGSDPALAPLTVEAGDASMKVADPKVARIGQLFAKRQTWRLVFKDGTCNVSSKNVTQRKKRYLVDLFTTFVDMRWRYNLVMFGLAFVGSWFLFSLVWWAVAVLHGDHLHANDTERVACVGGVTDFSTALLFSIETQHTIGYGTRAIEAECPHAVIVLMIQSCVGVFIQSLMTGLLFAKLSRPKGRAQTLIFSQKAVVCQRDGEYCLLFRLGDMRKSHIISTSIRALIVKNRVTQEGESIPLCQYTLGLETETNFSDGFVFLVWPVTVVHRIDATSPLWEMSAESLLSEHFEIVVILEGILESTGMTTQFRASYLPTEILWGQRLAPLLTYQGANGQYEIDFKHFHKVIPVDSMPECSAKEYHKLHRGPRLSATAATPREKHFPVNFAAQTVIPRGWSSIRRKLRKASAQSVGTVASGGVEERSEGRTRSISGEEDKNLARSVGKKRKAEKRGSGDAVSKLLDSGRKSSEESRSVSDTGVESARNLIGSPAEPLLTNKEQTLVGGANKKKGRINLYGPSAMGNTRS